VPEGESAGRPQPEAQGDGATSRGKRFWKWFVPAATAILVAVAGGLFTKMGESTLGLGDAGKSSSSTPTPNPKGDPIKLTKVTPIPRVNDKTWLYPRQLSAATVSGINKAYLSYEKSTDEIMRSGGGVENDVSTVELELEGNRTKPVRITDIGVVKHCTRPLNGAVFSRRPQGADETVKIGFDLDRDPVIGQYSTGDESAGSRKLTGNYFADHKYVLKLGEQATFRLSAVTRRHYCEYSYELRYIADGKPATMNVNDHGRLFRVSALIEKKGGATDCAAYRQRWVWAESGWTKATAAGCG
jgi:hypothetical protein